MQHDNAPDGELTYRIICLAMRVHHRLGPGLLESIYEKCLCYELARAEIPFRRQVPLPVRYDDAILDTGYTADIIADNQVILELKAVEHVLPIHEVQLLTYLRITDCRIGLLINCNTVSLTDGIRRRVLKHRERIPPSPPRPDRRPFRLRRAHQPLRQEDDERHQQRAIHQVVPSKRRGAERNP